MVLIFTFIILKVNVFLKITSNLVENIDVKLVMLVVDWEFFVNKINVTWKSWSAGILINGMLLLFAYNYYGQFTTLAMWYACRTIVDGEGSLTVFNGLEPMVDKKYTRGNRFMSGNRFSIWWVTLRHYDYFDCICGQGHARHARCDITSFW